MTVSPDIEAAIRRAAAYAVKTKPSVLKRKLHAELSVVGNCSISTVKRILAHSDNDNTTPRCAVARRPTKTRAARRAAVRQLATKTKVINGVTCPAFPTCRSIVAGLEAQKPHLKAGRLAIRNDLRTLGFKNYVRTVIPGPSTMRRKEFAQAMLKRKDLHRLVVSDETFVSTNDKSSSTMWAQSREDVITREQQRRQNVPHFQVWGAFGRTWRSDLEIMVDPIPPRVNPGRGRPRTRPITVSLDSKTYQQRCLKASFLAKLREKDAEGRAHLFLQDGASCHTAKDTVEFLKKNKIDVVPNWPPRSPDLNPIENLWAYLHNRIAEQHPATHEQLQAVAKAQWAAIPQSMMAKLIDSFPGRCKIVAQTG
jgi:transposase